MGFVIHWNESAMDLHVFPILIPPPTSPSTRSLWVFPVHQAWALVSCIQPGLVICFTLRLTLVFWFYCLNCQQLVFLPDFFQLTCRTLKVFLPKGKFFPKGKWDKNEVKEGENTVDERAFMKKRTQWQHSLKSIMKLSVQWWLAKHSQESKIPCTPKSWKFVPI